MGEILKFQDVDFYYSKEKKVLENVNFSINQGDFVGIIGPNGGGKTSLLKIILGNLNISNGYQFNNVKTNKEDIGYIPQFFDIQKDYPLTVEEIIKLGNIYNRNFLSRQYRQLLDKDYLNQILKKLDIYKVKDSLIGDVSGGERQRTMMARALIKKPSIIIGDEITSNIDLHKTNEIFDFLRELNFNGNTVILVTHDIFLLKNYANKIIDVNKHIHFHDPNEIDEKKIYQSILCPECDNTHK